MNYYTKKKIYDLVPSIYRQRDIKTGRQMEALLGVISEQVEIIERDIENLYENWFIETCDDWVVPYIGDLVGAKLLQYVENAPISQRAWVANTIRYRKRKGTAAVIEQIALDVTGWSAKVVEFFQLLNTNQNINHLRPKNHYSPSLRELGGLELVDTPFDVFSHTPDVRCIKDGLGYHNIHNLGIFLWRIRSFPVHDFPAHDYGEGRYGFSPLGFDTQLFSFPSREPGVTHLAGRMNVPHPIKRSSKNNTGVYYGNGKSMLLEVNGNEVQAENIEFCNLDGWKYRPKGGKVAIDPELGRISFPENAHKNTTKVRVSYYYGFSGDIGGGFYDRRGVGFGNHHGIDKVYKISQDSSLGAYDSITEALLQWEDNDGKPSAVFEITDSGFYPESFSLALPDNCSLIIKSSNGQRPVLRAKPGVNSKLLEITGGKNSRLAFEGLLMDKSLGIRINEGDLRLLSVNHCTLTPRMDPSITLQDGNDALSVTIKKSITGKIALFKSEAKLVLTDSIADVKVAGERSHEEKPGEFAICCFNALIGNSTVFGKVSLDLMEQASNSIFNGTVKVKRRQRGCVRFSYVPKGSEIPTSYRCIPDDQSKTKSQTQNLISGARPWFTSEHYGDAGYSQLNRYVASEIFRGADNGSEMGVFNSLYQPQRIKNLELCLDEYLRFGLEAGIVMVDADSERTCVTG